MAKRIIDFCARGHNSHGDGFFRWGEQPKEVRPVEIEYVEDNIEKN